MKIKIKIKKSHAFIILGAFAIFLISLINSGNYINSQTGIGHDLDELPAGYFPVGFEVTGDLIINDIILENLARYYPANSLLNIISYTNGSYDIQLVHEDHGASDCTRAGGVRVTANESDPLDEDYFCRFSGGCPSGWTEYESWMTTGGISECCNNIVCNHCCSSVSGHAWANAGRDEDYIRTNLNCGKDYFKAEVLERGCY